VSHWLIFFVHIIFFQAARINMFILHLSVHWIGYCAGRLLSKLSPFLTWYLLTERLKASMESQKLV
jgi:hypothetical protein